MTPLILVVDDEPQIQDLLELMLKEKGYMTQKCATGESAMKMMEEIEFNLVILDLNLPGVNGFEVSEYIKENHHNTPIVFITGSQSAEAISLENDCRSRCDMKLLYKPIDIQLLNSTLDTLIQNSLAKGKRSK